MFMALITSPMYQLKTAGAKTSMCQEADPENGLQCLNSNTNVCTELEHLVRESRRQRRDPLLSRTNLCDLTLKTWAISLQGGEMKSPFRSVPRAWRLLLCPCHPPSCPPACWPSVRKTPHVACHRSSTHEIIPVWPEKVFLFSK